MEHKRGKVLHSDARKVVYNVIKYFEEEKYLKRYSHPFQYSNARASVATGLARNTISKIKKEGDLAIAQGTQIRTPKKGARGTKNTRVPVDNFTLVGIRGIISSIYDVTKEVPTLNKILAAAKKDFNFKGSKSTLRIVMKNKLGFEFKKGRKNRPILLERTNIKAWRTTYLRRIRHNDVLGTYKKPVIYLDETSIQSLIIVHAGSEDGFVKGADLIIKSKSKKGDDNDDMNAINFTKYIKEKLIPNIPENCIVVIDDAPHHNTQINKPPSIADQKAEIQNWLREKQIFYDETWTKDELLALVKKYKPEKEYAIDKLLADNGHETLRLPPYNCDLNPMEYVWNLVKRVVEVAEKNVDQKNIEGLTRQAISSITAEDWKKEVKNIKRLEDDYWTRDVVNEAEMEDLIIRAGLNSDSESESENESDDDEDASSDVEELPLDHLPLDVTIGEGTSNM